MNKKKIYPIFFLSVIIVLVIIKATINPDGDRKKVYTTKAIKRNIKGTVIEEGVIRDRIRVNISSKILGEIKKVCVTDGSHVRKGDTLLVIERNNYEINVRKAKVSLEISLAQLNRDSLLTKNYKVKYENARILYSKKLISEIDYQQAELDYELGQCQFLASKQLVLQARENLYQANDDLDHTLILSPVKGVVLKKNVEIGETVIPGTVNNPGSILLIISALDTLDIEVDINQNDVHKIQNGQIVHATLQSFPDTAFIAKVKQVLPYPFKKDDQTYYKIIAVLLASHELFKPGMTIKAEIEIDKNVYTNTLPIESIIMEEQSSASNKNFIYVVSENNRIHKIDVRIGRNDLNYVEISNDISKYNNIVYGPYKTIKNITEGEYVKIVDETAK